MTYLGFVNWPSWSPDGNRILFMTDEDGGGLWSTPAATGLALFPVFQ